MAQHQYLFASGNAAGSYGKMFRIDRKGKTTEILVNWLVEPTSGFNEASFTPDNRYCAIATGGGSWRLRILKRISSMQWDEIDVSTKVTFPSGISVGSGNNTARFSPDGKWLALGTSNSFHILKVNPADDTFVSTEGRNGSYLGIISIDWISNTRLSVLSGSNYPPFVYHFDIDPVTGIRTLVPFTYEGGDPPSGLAIIRYSPDGKYLAMGGASVGTFRLYSVSGDTYTLVTTFAPNMSVDRIAWSKDSAFLAVSGNTAPNVFVWKQVNGTFIPLEALGTIGFRGLYGLSFNADGSKLYVASSSNNELARVERFSIDPIDLSFTKDSGIIFPYVAVPTAMNLNADFVTPDVATKLYNDTLADLVNHNVSTATLKLMLLNAGAVFDPAHTTLDQVATGHEVFIANWPQGGLSLTNVGYVKEDQDASFTLDIGDVEMLNGGPLIFANALIYDDSHPDKKPLVFLDYSNTMAINQFDTLSLSLATDSLIFFMN